MGKRATITWAALLCLWPAAVWPAAAVEYSVAFDNAAHHEARISVTYRDIGAEALVLRMARSSPGRYAIHEFAKNVYAVAAVDGAGNSLPVERVEPYSWRVPGHDGTVTASYTLYADHGDGTYSQVDSSHAHLNMPATFLWASGFEQRPVTITFEPFDEDWKAATQLHTTRRPMTFRAPNLQYFMDSPTELSSFSLRTWQVEHRGEKATIRLAVHHLGTEEDVDHFAAMAKNVVSQQVRLFDDIPDFDAGTYTFIADYLPQVTGDGMEHRNSTILTASSGLYEADFEQLGTLSHEFIHAWNVERLRPAELEPFDFTRANPTPNLWFAEGFTTYYGPLLIRRAGESKVDEYLKGLGRAIDTVVRGTGRRFASPREMSLRAPFVDDATAVDPVNTANTFVSYYTYGAVIALTLDLTLRQQFDVTLDDYMRHLWQRHGVTETPYTSQDLEAGLAEVIGDADFARSFFANHVERSDLPDLAPLLGQAGLELHREHAGKASLGRVPLRANGNSVVIDGNLRIGEPLYEAGLDRGDELLAVGRFDIDEEADVEAALERHRPGERLAVRYLRRGTHLETVVELVENATLEVRRFESADRTPTPKQQQFRDSWLGAEVDQPDP